MKKQIVRIKTWRRQDINIFRSLAKDLKLAYLLYISSKVYADRKTQEFCKSQFLTVKNNLEVMSRFRVMYKEKMRYVQ